MRFSFYSSILPALFVIFFSFQLLGQAYNNEQGGASVPSAAALEYGKYADIPVNQYTGTGNIAVPLFSVSDGSLSLAIGLQYHTGGIPVGTPAGAVGLGWNLNYGGMISRTVRGLADDRSLGFYNWGFVNRATEANAEDSADGLHDPEPDIYTYTAGGYSGKFTFTPDKQIKTIPQSDVVITVDKQANGFEGFVITTPDGNKYYFGTSADGLREAADWSVINGTTFVGRSGWHLLDVKSHDDKHHIRLTYEEVGYSYRSLSFCDGTIKYRHSSGSVNTSNECLDTYQTNMIASSLPATIETPLQTIDFLSSVVRDDLDDFDGSRKAKKIFKVKMTDGPNCVAYDFSQSYFYSNSSTNAEKRLRLDAIQKTSCVSGSTLDEPQWVFDYLGTDLGSGKQFFPAYEDTNIDHWGYYNFDVNEGSNTGDLTPPSSFFLGNSYIDHGSANRESNEPSMLNGVLNKVTYPTGGSLELEYEANEYYNSGDDQIYADLLACQTDNCGGTNSETSSAITFTQDMIDNGSWELCLTAFDDSGPNNGYDPNNNLARVEVYNSSNTIIQTREFNSTTDFCQSGSFPFISLGTAIQAGQSYTFKVTSLNANARFVIRAPGNGTNKIVGGLRIKKTTVHDRVNSANDIITNYDYLDEGSSNSSGQLFREPNYAYQLNAHTVLFTSYFGSPLSSFGGSHVGYARVVISQPGNGQTEMIFETEDDQANVHLQFPVPPAKYKAEAGTLNSSEVKTESSNIITTSSTTRYSGDTYELIGNASGDGVLFSARNVKTYDGSGSSLNDDVAYTTYQLRTGIYRPDIVTTTKDGVVTSMNYDYHPNNLLADEIVTTNSNGDTYKSQTTYVTDYVTTSLRDEFEDRNIKYPTYRTYLYQNNDYVDGARNYYRFFDQNGDNPGTSNGSGKHPRLYSQQRYTRTFDANGNLQSGSYVDQMHYTDYSDDGLLASYNEPNWNPLTIIYNTDKLPASKSFLGHTTQYIYETNGSKLASVVAVDGTQTDYDYDDLMRLESIDNVCQSITTTYDYNLNNGAGVNNYVSVLTTYPTDPTGRSQVNSMETISYKDGLGRELQKIAKELGPNSNEDIISAVSYDQYGRVKKIYEPQSFTNNSGNYKSPTSGWDYNTITYEASPMGRKLSDVPVDWYSTTYTYGSNTSSDAVKIDGGTSTYASGSLMKTTITDPNGNKLITFVDKKGRKVLSRRTNAADQTSKRLDTYHVYDRKDRLVKVLPPDASASNSDLIYTYLYDGEDRILEKKIPGKAYIEYRYNNRDLLAAEQDGNLRASGDWFAYSYDAFGREQESGFYNSTPPASITDLIPNEALHKTFYGTGSEKDKVKTVETKILDGGNDWLTTTNTYSSCGILTSQSGNNHLSLTGSETTTYTYDGAVNVVGTTYAHNGPNSSSHTITSSHYFDHAGRAEKNYIKVDAGTNRQLNEFVYDRKGQVTKKYQGKTGLSGSNEFLQEINYSYLKNGILSGINLNIGGALSGNKEPFPVNGQYGNTPNPNTSGNSYDDKDLFQLQLYRTNTSSATSGATPRYNGDVSAIATQVKGRKQQLWKLGYDHVDRLTSSELFERFSHHGGASTLGFEENLTYDDRGNIETLERIGPYKNSGGQYFSTTLDNLNYNTPSDNQVIDISDSGSSSYGYKDGAGNYVYDANGNMTEDPSKDIVIAYNHLDLPITITWNAPSKQLIELTYDASGALLTRKTYADKTLPATETRDYVGGIEYLDESLESVYHEEGRIKFDGSNQEWQYTLTDHLGNTRLVYADLNNNGIPEVPGEIIQEEHYYPFGMKMEGPWMGAAAGAKTAYQYNGIEHIEDFDLNVNMAFYRTLDPLTGRWWQVDPKAESFMSLSPYNSMGNSPINFADPAGDEPITLSTILIGMAIGAGTHTASHLVQNNFTFQNWNWGNFIGSTVAGGVTAGAGHFLEARHIGGFAGGFITGASAGLSHSLTSNIINPGFNPGQIASTTLFSGLSAGIIGGLSTGKGYSFWNGRSTTLTERYLIGPGGTTPLTEGEINDGEWLGSRRMSLEDAIERGEVGGTGPGATDAIATQNPTVRNVSPGFEGPLRVRGGVYDSGGRDFVLTVDGKTQVLPTGRIDLSIPSSAKNIGWGFRGNRALQSATLGNNRVGLSVSADSYLYITGNHRGWNGFLFWGRR